MKRQTIYGALTLLFAMLMTFHLSTAQTAAPTTNPTSAPKGATVSAPPPASNYSWKIPVQGMPKIPVWNRGQTYTLKWTGGPPGPVQIYLVNWCTWTSQMVIVASTPNSHSYSWTIPSNLPCGVFECYIQNANGPATNWSYSFNFAITKP